MYGRIGWRMFECEGDISGMLRGGGGEGGLLVSFMVGVRTG